MKLTDTSAAKATLPDGKDDGYVWCDGLPAFGVRMRRKSDGFARNWYIKYRVGRKQGGESLGDIRKVRAEDARRIAQQRFAAIAEGRDVAAEREAAKVEAEKRAQTLGVTVPQYLAYKVKRKQFRPLTLIAAKRYLERHFEPLHSKPIDTITRKDVAALVLKLEDQHGVTSAARARSQLLSMFAWCIQMGLVENNPVSGSLIPDKDAKFRDRVLTDDEVRTVWQALDDNKFGQIVRLLFYTGCRRQEIANLRWSDIDMKTGVMTLTPEHTKNGEGLELTLPPPALEMLKAIPRNKHRGDFIFGKKGEKGWSGWSFYMGELNKRIKANTGKSLPHWTLHDIRRSVRTNLSALGVVREIAEAVIGHKPPKIVGTYDKHVPTAEIKAALLLWQTRLHSIVDDQPAKSNVIPIRMQAAE